MGFSFATFNCQSHCQSQFYGYSKVRLVPRGVPGVTLVTLQTLSAQRIMEKPK